MKNNKEIELLEKKYNADNYDGTEYKNSSILMVPGNIPVLINAPHAVCQLRNGKRKVADAYTGSMAEWICKETGAHGCIHVHNDNCDPNFDRTGSGKTYRDNLGNYCRKHNIQLMIDLHGSADTQIVCEIGTNDGENLCDHQEYLESLKKFLSVLGKVIIDEHFRASKTENISRTMARDYEIPSIQLEIGSVFRKSPTKRMEFLRCLADFIATVYLTSY